MTTVQHKARQTLYAFPNEIQTNSRLNNIIQALSKVLPQTELYTDIARPLFTSRSDIARSRSLLKAGRKGNY